MAAQDLNQFCDDFVQATAMTPIDYSTVEEIAWKIESVLRPFDWMNWTEGSEAIKKPELILHFSREDALRLLQMITRQQRFREGDFSINGKYVSTKHSHFAEMRERGVLENIASVIEKTKPSQLKKCDLCMKGHVNGIKTMSFPDLTVNFCVPCAKKRIMKNSQTGEERTLYEIYAEAARDF